MSENYKNWTREKLINALTQALHFQAGHIQEIKQLTESNDELVKALTKVRGRLLSIKISAHEAAEEATKTLGEEE